MRKRFESAVAFVLDQEGDWTTDTGGATRFGISQRAYPNMDLSSLTVEDAKRIYRRDYWDALTLGELPWPLDLAMLDVAVNLGNKEAVKCLQSAVNQLGECERLEVDGLLGPVTLGAVQSPAGDRGRATLLAMMVALGRLDMHYQLAAHDNYALYMRGWAGRCVRLCEEIVRVAAATNMEDENA